MKMTVSIQVLLIQAHNKFEAVFFWILILLKMSRKLGSFLLKVKENVNFFTERQNFYLFNLFKIENDVQNRTIEGNLNNLTKKLTIN